jgi:hypothetical protein
LDVKRVGTSSRKRKRSEPTAAGTSGYNFFCVLTRLLHCIYVASTEIQVLVILRLWEFDSPRPHKKFFETLPPSRESVGFGSKVVGAV